MKIEVTHMPECKPPQYPYNTRVGIDCTLTEEEAIRNWLNENDISCSIVPYHDGLIVYATEKNATAIVMSFG